MTHTATCTDCGASIELAQPLPTYVTRYKCPECFPKFEERLNKIERALIRLFDEMGYESEEDIDTMWKASGHGGQFNLTELAVEINDAIDAPLESLPTSAKPLP